MRVFLDTNVLVSALTARGICADLFQIVVADHKLLTASQVLEELLDVLPRKFGSPGDVVDGYLELLRQESELLASANRDLPQVEDLDDAPILAAALAGGAELFVTGDKALLELGEIEKLPIVSPRRFWEILAAEI